jgi:T5orf172 domain
MPSVSCEYCNATASTNGNLLRHQKSKSCLAVQKQLGLNPNPTMLMCKCGFSTAIKCQLEAHIPRCKMDKNTVELSEESKDPEPATTYGQLFETIRAKIQSLEPEIMEKGIQCMMCAISSSFKNQGLWMARIADASRNKFSFMENGRETFDIKGVKIATLIRHEFIKATISILKQAREMNDRNKIIGLEKLVSSLQEEDECYSEIIKGLMKFLPNRFEYSRFENDIQTEDLLKDLKQVSRAQIDEKEPGNLELSDGFVYVIKEREFIKTEENVFKIGRTNRQIGERLCEYPKGSRPYYFENVENSEKVEGMILKKLMSIPTEFKHRHDIGHEYFEGNIRRLIFIIKSITIDEYVASLSF